jgi:predicted Fe-Mo cluster-binding NifX family protein
MKIAISAQGTDLSALLDPRFGRSQFFLIYDSESGRFEMIDNHQRLDLPQGAGIQAARTVINCGAEVVLTGHCGPKAFRTLNAADLHIFVGLDGTVGEALDRFLRGEIQPTAGADVDGHWQTPSSVPVEEA